MNIRKTLAQTLFILIVSALLGLANNYLVSDNPVTISTERPRLKTAADSKFEKELEPPAQPVVLDKEQLKRLLSRDNVVVIDARMPEEYASGHIPGAINIPFDQLGEHMAKVDALSQEKWLVAYCEGPPCDKGQQLAYVLFDVGFDKVAYYDAGLDDWKTTEELAQ